VYGGLITSPKDCHSTGSGAAAPHKQLEKADKKEIY